MVERKVNADRLGAFSDAVIAVIITIMVLELRAPDEATFEALLPLWPTAISYAVSYLFIAIVWTNHHYLMRNATQATPRLCGSILLTCSRYRCFPLRPPGWP